MSLSSDACFRPLQRGNKQGRCFAIYWLELQTNTNTLFSGYSGIFGYMFYFLTGDSHGLQHGLCLRSSLGLYGFRNCQDQNYEHRAAMTVSSSSAHYCTMYIYARPPKHINKSPTWCLGILVEKPSENKDQQPASKLFAYKYCGSPYSLRLIRPFCSTLERQGHKIFDFRFPLGSWALFQHFFRKFTRYSQLKVNRRYQRNLRKIDHWCRWYRQLVLISFYYDCGDIVDKFATGVKDAGGKLPPVYKRLRRPFAISVSDTSGQQGQQ